MINIGDTNNGGIEVQGARDEWQFSATAGQHIFIDFTNLSNGRLISTLRAPDGSQVLQRNATSVNAHDVDVITLNQSGTYTYVMDGDPAIAHDGESLLDASGAEPSSLWGESAAADENLDQSWDREHPAEGRASEWSNDAEGFRVEDVEQIGHLDQLDESSTEDETYGQEDYGQPEAYDESYDSDETDSPSYDEPNYEQQEYEEEGYDQQDYEQQDVPATESDPPAPPMGEVGDDDSIEAYMNRLLQRVQGEPGSDSSEPETVSVSTSSELTTTSLLHEREVNDDHEAVAASSEEAIDPDAPLVPRSQAPSASANMIR